MADPPPPGGRSPSGRPSAPGRRARRPRRERHPDDSLLLGGLSGIALVTAATVVLVAAGALIAGLVALLYP